MVEAQFTYPIYQCIYSTRYFYALPPYFKLVRFKHKLMIFSHFLNGFRVKFSDLNKKNFDWVRASSLIGYVKVSSTDLTKIGLN